MQVYVGGTWNRPEWSATVGHLRLWAGYQPVVGWTARVEAETGLEPISQAAGFGSFAAARRACVLLAQAILADAVKALRAVVVPDEPPVA